MTAVCDASVVFKLLIVEEDSDQAARLLASTKLSAPDLVFAEIGNALWTHTHDGRLDINAGQILIEKLYAMPLDVHPTRLVLASALRFAADLDHPIYDCVYLALAEHLKVPLVTADQRFLGALRRAKKLEVAVTALRDFA